MNKPETLQSWDWPDAELVKDGYDWTEVPKSTDDNFRLLVKRYNELVEFVHEIADRAEAKREEEK